MLKFSKYNIIVEENQKLIVYNSKNNKFLKISNIDEFFHFKELLSKPYLSDNDKMVKTLFEHGYIVKKDINEYLEAKKDIDRILKEDECNIDVLLYVTENCNFRCVYCPEEHVDKNFSKKNWGSFYKYIEKNIKSGKTKSIRIRFFGGEPLLGSKYILDFLEKINIQKKAYRETAISIVFVTNGYLLTPKLYDKLANFDFEYIFQITVDGFAEQHDKTRPRVDGSGTWNTIIENIKYIDSKQDRTKIIIRANINCVNEHSIKDFYSWVDKTFISKNIYFHCVPVGARSEKVNEKYIREDGQYIDMLNAVQTNVSQYDREYLRVHSPLKKLGYICTCARRGGFSISTDGKIYKCHDSYNNKYKKPVGYLNDDGDIVYTKNLQEIENYELEDCKSCNVYPLCAGRMCPGDKLFDPINRPDCHLRGKTIEYQVEQFILNTYLRK